LPVETTHGIDEDILLAQEKPADLLQLVVEETSVLRVSIHSRSAKNQISAFLLEKPDSKEALAWTKASGNSATFVYLVEVEMSKTKAFTLKIVYDSLD